MYVAYDEIKHMNVTKIIGMNGITKSTNHLNIELFSIKLNVLHIKIFKKVTK